MAAIITDEEGFIAEPCLSCEKAKYNTDDNEFICYENNCIIKNED